MNVVILQPSYIPWRGYFHQIAKADVFVFYDDVQYDKHGWRNRNRIKTAQGQQWLTIPVHSAGAVEGLLVKDAKIDWARPWAANHWKSLTCAYARAPYFRRYAPLLEPFYRRRDALLAEFTVDLTIAIARGLGMHHTRFMRSSEIPGISGRKTDRLIQILTRVGATHFISGPTSKDYIEEDRFARAGITLEYMSYEYPEYPQRHAPYDAHVSIVDLLFMTGPNAARFML